MYKKLLFFSDAAVIPRPTLEQFEAMLRYDLEAVSYTHLDVYKRQALNGIFMVWQK